MTACGRACEIHVDFPVPRGPKRKLESSGMASLRANTRQQIYRKNAGMVYGIVVVGRLGKPRLANEAQRLAAGNGDAIDLAQLERVAEQGA